MTTKRTRSHLKDYAEAIVETIREPLVVLDANLRVLTANRSFYKIFHVNKKETEHKLIYKLGMVNGTTRSYVFYYLILFLKNLFFKILKLNMTFLLLEKELYFLMDEKSFRKITKN